MRWHPPIALSPEEQKMAARTQKARKFLVFLSTILTFRRFEFELLKSAELDDDKSPG